MWDRPKLSQTALLTAAGGVAAVGLSADWFGRPEFRAELDGHEAFRAGRWLAVAGVDTCGAAQAT